jgi:RNA polymerase sigma-70 factor (ECF subfamily)
MVDSLQTEIAAANLVGQSASPLTATSDSLLVALARNGEHLAYIELCRRNREIVLRTVVRITHNLDDAEDVLQDSWMRAFTHIRTFDGRSAFSSWVTRIAINSALTMIRKRRRQKEFSLDDPVDPNCRRLTEMLEPSRNPEERCLEAERIRLVRQAIERLPSKLRTAIEIRQSQDGSVSELAMLAGVSLPTMKSRLVRARLRLREPLAQVLNGRPASDISRQAKRADSVRKRPRRQSGFEKITLAHDHHSGGCHVIRLNEIGVPSNNNEDSHRVIDQRAACESISDAEGLLNGQSVAD